MRSLFLLLSFLCVACPSSAQTENYKKLKWGMSIAINSMEAQIGIPEESSWGYATSNFKNYGDKTNKSLSISFIPKYFISDDFILRFEFGISNISLKSYYDSQINNSANPASSHIIIDQSIEQKINRYILGLQWNFMSRRKVEPFCGFSVSYLHYNDMRYRILYETRNIPGDTLIMYADENSIAKGGFATGMGAFAGFNIYIFKTISLGAEFSTFLFYYKIGGEFGGKGTTQNIPNPPITETFSTTTTSYKGIQFSKVLSSFNISISF